MKKVKTLNNTELEVVIIASTLIMGIGAIAFTKLLGILVNFVR
jgi:hypothetical protein